MLKERHVLEVTLKGALIINHQLNNQLDFQNQLN